MQQNFTFIGDEVAKDWRFDERTKNLGRKGIEAARRTLAGCRHVNELAA